MAVRRPLIIDGGSIKELPSGDTLPAPGKTAATLTHSGGVVTLDVQAADMFRFEADEYVAPASISVLNTYGGSGSTIDLTGWGLQADDYLLYFTRANVPLGEGFSLISETTGNNTGDLQIYEKWIESPPESAYSTNTFGSNCAVLAFRGVDSETPLDTAPVSLTNAAGTVINGPSITTVSDGALVITANRHAYSQVFSGEFSGFTTLELPGFVNASNYFIGYKERAEFGMEDPPAYSANQTNSNWIGSTTLALRPILGSGEKDYTFTFSNIPASGLASGVLDIELKTDTGSVAFAGGSISWRGAVPSFDDIGRYLIAYWADSTGITLLDLTAAVSAGGAMSGAAIVSAINAELGGSTWQGGAGGGVALWKAKGNNQGNNYANTSADVGWNAWAIDGGSDLTLSGAQITAVTAGTYLFAVTVRANGDNRVELRIQAHRDTGSGFSALADEIVDDYIMRDTDQDRGAVTLHCALELSAGDKIKFVAEGNVDGACTGLAAGTSLIAQKVA